MANKYKIVLMALAMTSSCVALKAQTEDLEKLLDAGNKPQKQKCHFKKRFSNEKIQKPYRAKDKFR